jgi:hypothetical protein
VSGDTRQGGQDLTEQETYDRFFSAKRKGLLNQMKIYESILSTQRDVYENKDRVLEKAIEVIHKWENCRRE